MIKIICVGESLRMSGYTQNEPDNYVDLVLDEAMKLRDQLNAEIIKTAANLYFKSIKIKNNE